ncbi:hypothetical protein [Zoogloea sp. LCSB751]|uniref:hypothetical protein n=1 Tax=Zoogloea sp. LCSB751 TaxID=1965277 RepID=UPI000B496BF3|nr:hypothetical protein [Zoogloea sp. LCSB751]
MSLSWPERATLHIGPDALRLQCRAGAIERPLIDADWGAALAALPVLPRFSRLRVRIADRYVRYLRVAWPPGLSAEERRVFVEYRFVEVFGAGPWAVLTDRNAAGPQCLAAALPLSLRDALRDWARTRRLSLRAVEPAFLADFNEGRRRLRGDGAFARQERGRVTIGLWAAGAWRALRSLPVGEADGRAAVDGLVALLATLPEAPAAGTFHVAGVQPADAPLPSGWTHADCAEARP